MISTGHSDCTMRPGWQTRMNDRLREALDLKVKE